MSGSTAVRWTAALFFATFALVLFELVLVRVFAVVLFAAFAHLALGLALLGTSAGALAHVAMPALSHADGPRLGRWALLQGWLAVAAVALVVQLPFTADAGASVETFQERSSLASQLVDPWMLLLAIGVLALPFAVGGAVVAGALSQAGRRAGMLYGGDLVGGATAGLLLAPSLAWLPAPDLAVLCLLATAAAAACFGATRPAVGTGALALLALIRAGGSELLPIRYAAGIPETHVVEARWTALARLAVHEGPERTLVMLDNTSASEVVRTEAARERLWNEAAARSLVYRVAPKGRVAILAASAGPEIAVAQRGGFIDIDAIDIAGDIGDIVAQRYAHDPVNPYAQPGVRRITADGRAAVAHSATPYTVIQMVHANLHGAAGLLAAAWSPGLLTTREAFSTYLDHLEDDGIASFAAGVLTESFVPSAVAALRERGLAPEDCLVVVGGNQPVLLVRPRPWTAEEVRRVAAALRAYRNAPIEASPGTPLDQRYTGRPMTDDRPYASTRGLKLGFVGDTARVFGALSQILAVQAAGLLGYGLLALAPALVVLRRRGARGLFPALVFGTGIGFGYLALETVLVHRFVLVVGHPTWAIGAVVGSMMASSGVASLFMPRVPDRLVRTTLFASLICVVVVGATLPAWVAPTLDAAFALSPMPVRAGVVALWLAPLGAVMGMPMALGLRLLGDPRLVPWVWAVNGWMSVLATVATVVLSREWGFATASAAALGAYLLSAMAVGWLGNVEPRPASG